MPLPPPGRARSRSNPAIAASTPSSATVAPVIVPWRTSSATAATTSAADERGPRAARRRRGPGSGARARRGRTATGTRPRRRRRRARRRGRSGAPRRHAARPVDRRGERCAATSATVRNGGSTRSTCGANSDPASTSRAGPSATMSPSPSTTARRRAACRELDVVRREHDRAARGRVRVHRRFERVARRRVHAARRLVEQQHPAPPTATAAIATRCRSPPERLRGWRSREVDEVERVEPRVDGRRGRGWPSSRSVSASSRRRSARTAACSGPGARTRRRSARGRPCRRRARAGRPSVRSRVVLPEPLRPSSATTSPRADLEVDPPRARGGRRGRRRARARAATTGAAVPARAIGRRPAARPARPSTAQRAGVAHGERQRVPAEQPAEVGDGRRAGVAGEHGAPVAPAAAMPPAGDEHGAVGERRGALEPVLGEHDGRAEVVVQSGERGEHVVGALRIELRRGLVEHEHRGRGGQRAGDRAALALAARQRRRVSGRGGGRCRARRAPPRPAAASRRVGTRGSRARTRGRARRGRRRTGPRGPGATKPTTSASSRGWCVRVERPTDDDVAARTARRWRAARARSRRAAACSCPSPRRRRRAATSPAATSRSTSVERDRAARGRRSRHAVVREIAGRDAGRSRRAVARRERAELADDRGHAQRSSASTTSGWNGGNRASRSAPR